MQAPVFITPPEALSLPGPNDVHVWHFGPGDVSFLSEDERKVAERMKNPDARRSFVDGRTGVRKALSHYHGGEAAGHRISIAKCGRPEVGGGPHFSIAHSRGAVFAAFASFPIGFDFEFVDDSRDIRGIARRYLESFERDRIASGELSFWQVWTAREALAKLDGRGLAFVLMRSRVREPDTGELCGRTVHLFGFDCASGTATVASYDSFSVKGWFRA